jgi:hypothetical protein
MNILQSRKDEKGPPVIGAGRTVCCTDTRVGTAPCPTNIATALNQGNVSSPTTTEGTILSSTTQQHVPITGIMRVSSSQANMPRRNRLNPNGNGPDDFDRDSLVRGWGAGQLKLVVANSAAKAEMGQRAGCGAPSEDSRPDFSSRTGSQPWTGGNDTILTPFSRSPMTDSVVDSLPELFLAYCTLADTNDVLSPNDQVAPRGSGSDPVLLLTNCAFGLGPSFLSHRRR